MPEHWKYPKRSPASDDQISYIRSLARDRRLNIDRALRLRWSVAVDDLDSGSASAVIDLLKGGGDVVPMYREIAEPAPSPPGVDLASLGVTWSGQGIGRVLTYRPTDGGDVVSFAVRTWADLRREQAVVMEAMGRCQ
jgi:hypothetical protein